MQEEINQPLSCWYPIEEYDIIATLPRHITKNDYDTTAVILKPRRWYSGHMLAVRERAVGAKREQLVKDGGLPYWNHALYFRINDKEIDEFMSICEDADNFASRFSKLYGSILDKAYNIKQKDYSIVTAMAVYGGVNDNVLKGYITLPPVGCDYFKLRKFYDLWAWTKPR